MKNSKYESRIYQRIEFLTKLLKSYRTQNEKLEKSIKKTSKVSNSGHKEVERNISDLEDKVSAVRSVVK